MKKATKRILSLTMVLLIILSVTAVFSGCYVIKSGKMSQIEGTYQLTSYSGDGDRLTERGITMYVVVRADGTGYYAYKDNNTDPYISEIRCRFTQDTEDAGKYSYVEIDFGNNGDYVKFAVFAQLFELATTLSSQKHVFSGNIFEGNYGLDYTISSTLTRVDKATDLSAVEKNFGKAVTLPFGSKKYDGTYRLERIIGCDKTPEGASVPENPFVYYYVTLDFVKGTAKLYSMKKSDEIEIQDELKDLKITYENGNYVISVSEGINLKINTTNSDLNYSLDAEKEFDEGWFVMRFHHWGDMTEEQILDNIESDVNNYLASKDFSE